MLIQEILNQVKEVQNIINYIEEGYQIDVQSLEQELLKIKINGFAQLNDQSLNKILNMHKQQQVDFSGQLEFQTNLIIENAQKLKEESQSIMNQSQEVISIMDLKYKIEEFISTDQESITAVAISNDLKYIVAQRLYYLNIWDYESYKHIKSITMPDQFSSKFTNDSTLLYVGDSYGQLNQFNVKDQFSLIQKLNIYQGLIYNILCISNSIFITSSSDGVIIKTDTILNQQLFRIQAHNKSAFGLDYHNNLNTVVSGSEDKSIKLWNAQNGQYLMEYQNAHNDEVSQVLFDRITINQQAPAFIIQLYGIFIMNPRYQSR
ncbi:WD repeat-containing protein 33 [Paramecium bursaria]